MTAPKMYNTEYQFIGSEKPIMVQKVIMQIALFDNCNVIKSEKQFLRITLDAYIL